MVRRQRSVRPERRTTVPVIRKSELDDDALTADGLALSADAQGRVLLIACGALAREIIDIRDQGGWDHIDLTCLPAIYHNHPERIAEAVEVTVAKHRTTHGRICVVYADCGTGGLLEETCVRLGVEMVAGPHCYSFFEGNEAFAERDEISAFYLTDFLARQFDAFIWTPLGLDRHPELRDTYFGHYEKLVYLSQVDDPALAQRARGYADRLGLAFEHRRTGYGDLQTTIAGWAKRPS